MDRGLPTLMFGADKPVLELEAVRSRGDDARDGRLAQDALSGDPAPMLEAMECAPESASDRFQARMQQHIGRYGGST